RHSGLSRQQRRAFRHLTQDRDLSVLIGIAGSGKSTLIKATREAWEAQGYTVKGVTLAGIAAENLENASGVRSRTLASLENAWGSGRDALSAKDVLIIDEAGMLGSEQFARLVEYAQQVGAKIVALGDPEQLQSIEAGSAFRAIASRVGFVELTEV